MLCLSNVSVNVPLTQFYGFCKVTFEGKTFHVFYWLDKFHTLTNDPSSTVLSDVKCLFFVNVSPCIPVAGFDAVFDWHTSMLGNYSCVHIVELMPCSQLGGGFGYLNFVYGVHVTFLRFMCVHLVALIILLK